MGERACGRRDDASRPNGCLPAASSVAVCRRTGAWPRAGFGVTVGVDVQNTGVATYFIRVPVRYGWNLTQLAAVAPYSFISA